MIESKVLKEENLNLNFLLDQMEKNSISYDKDLMEKAYKCKAFTVTN